MQKLLIICLLLLSIGKNIAQTSNLRFQVKGFNSTEIIIGYLQGGKAYFVDSLKVDTTNGQFFLKKKGLQPGVYFCKHNNTTLFDFLIPDTTNTFSIGGDLAQPDSLWSTDSEENEAFFRFEQQRKGIERQFESKKAMRALIAQATKNDPEATESVEKELDQLIQDMEALSMDFIDQNPNHLYARMLRAVRPPNAPKSIKKEQVLRWQRLHYWDNTDFSNETLLNNAFWQVHFDNFFNRFVVMHPDSMTTAIDEVLRKVPRGNDFFRFIVLRITQFYELNETPGADRIFVHMVDKYQQKDATPWLDIATLERLAYRADAHRPNLTGSMAMNFTLPDENGKLVELYEIKAPLTLLIFYSPLCGHCMDQMPKIYQIYLDYQVKGLAAVALNTDEQGAYWKKFIKQQHWTWYDVDDKEKMPLIEGQYNTFNLPVIYILDKNKVILAKNVKADQLGALLGKYFELKN